jgi:hypothetical protein
LDFVVKQVTRNKSSPTKAITAADIDRFNVCNRLVLAEPTHKQILDACPSSLWYVKEYQPCHATTRSFDTSRRPSRVESNLHASGLDAYGPHLSSYESVALA